jgi:hypothetical protein
LRTLPPKEIVKRNFLKVKIFSLLRFYDEIQIILLNLVFEEMNITWHFGGNGAVNRRRMCKL